MIKLLEILHRFFLKRGILIFFKELQSNFEFDYYFFYNYKKNKYDENLYIYIKVRKILETLLTFIIFLILYIFDIRILNENFIIYYKYYIYIIFFIFLIWVLENIRKGFNKKESEYLKKGIKSLILLINFLINIKIIMWLFNISFEEYLQYNILFVLDSILVVILYIYDNIYNIKIKGERIENFIYYPYIIMIIIWMSLKRSKKLKIILTLFIKEYIKIFNKPNPMVYHGEKLEKEWENNDEILTLYKIQKQYEQKKKYNKKEKKND